MAPDKRLLGRFAPEMLLATKSLAHPLRLELVALIEAKPRRFSELLEATDRTGGTISPHLRHLQKGGIVAKEMRLRGEEIYEEYTISRFGQRVLVAWDQAFGQPMSSVVTVRVSTGGSERVGSGSTSERSVVGHNMNIPLGA